MRILLIAIAIAGGLPALTGCVASNDRAAVEAMNNQPNTCGIGGRPNIEDCRGHRW